MSIILRRRAELSKKQIADLEAALVIFYRNPPTDYYKMADASAGHYNPEEQPFHHDLIQRVFPSAKVLELGCGTAHLCPYVEQRGGVYTGFDYSEQLLEQNRRRFPNARFRQIGTPLEETFDIVASLFTLEHTIDPPAYLERMWNYCRPGGMLAVICPEFVDCPAFPNSVFFGRTVRRLRKKFQTLNFVDAASHLIDLKVRAALWKKQLRASAPGTFWINLQPAVLHGADYSSDADAVYLARLKDIVWFFEKRGAAILQTSDRMTGVSPEILRYGCYMLAQKPGSNTDKFSQRGNVAS